MTLTPPPRLTAARGRPKHNYRPENNYNIVASAGYKGWRSSRFVVEQPEVPSTTSLFTRKYTDRQILRSGRHYTTKPKAATKRPTTAAELKAEDIAQERARPEAPLHSPISGCVESGHSWYCSSNQHSDEGAKRQEVESHAIKVGFVSPSQIRRQNEKAFGLRQDIPGLWRRNQPRTTSLGTQSLNRVGYCCWQ